MQHRIVKTKVVEPNKKAIVLLQVIKALMNSVNLVRVLAASKGLLELTVSTDDTEREQVLVSLNVVYEQLF
jgi:hypothetical protein